MSPGGSTAESDEPRWAETSSRHKQLVATVSPSAGGGSWSSVSDRNMKDHLVPVNGQTVLVRLDAIPMASWNYQAQPASIRHLGPMAQDFYAAFGLGEDDKHITTVDEGGVAPAGVQALYRMEVDKNGEIHRLRNEVARLEAEEKQVESLTRQVTELRALVEHLAAERPLVASARH